MNMKTSKKYFISAAVMALIGLCLVAVDQLVHLDERLSLALYLVIIAAGLAALFLSFKSWRHERKEKGKPPFNRPGSSFFLWPLTLLLSGLTAVVCPASEVQASQAFKLMSDAGENDYVLTPVNGGSSISFSPDCVKIDKAKMLLITPAGSYKIIPVSENEVLLQGADGTLYRPNVSLCLIIVIIIAAGLVIYGGCKAYRCGCNIVSNYNRRLSNAENSSLVFSPAKAQAQLSGTDLLPALSDLSTNGAMHYAGPPPSIFRVPLGSTFWLTNLDNTNNTYGELVEGPTDIFGNAVNYKTLVIIEPSNSYVLDTNGRARPCWPQTSTNLVNWLDLTQVVFSYTCISGSPKNDPSTWLPLSATAVTYTPDLHCAYATNWFRFINGQIAESWTLAGCPDLGKQGFLRLFAP
jgi:hypothetical protein